MFQAQMLIVGAANATVKVYSPWFEKKADNLRVSAEMVAMNGATITVKVYSKSTETAGDGSVETPVSANIALSAVGRATEEYAGVKPQVRYGFECSGTTGQWALFRVLPPAWFDTVKGP